MMNFVTFAGYSITSKDKYTLSDQISILRAQSSFEGDFCGEKTFVFTVNETDTTYLSFNNPDYIHFSPPMNAKEFGIGQATVKAVLKSYSTIETPIISFTATILGSVVPIIPNQKYTQNQAPLAIPFEPFQVLPNDYVVGTNTVDAYIYTGTTIPNRIDPSCVCMTKVTDLDWIALDLSINTILVQTSNIVHVGVHKIVLVQSFENFAGVYPFAAFQLTIETEVIQFQIKKPPFFASELTNQIVTQCSNTTNELWFF